MVFILPSKHEMRKTGSQTYSAYGLRINCDIELKELLEDVGEPDVAITFQPIEEEYLRTALKDATRFERPGCIVQVKPDAACYFWKGIGTALIENGKTVTIDTEPDFDVNEMAPFITGAILGNVLSQRGMMVLHGSAIAIDGKAHAFLGEKGAGKSTIALHMELRGYPLLTDDLLPVELTGSHFQTIAGFPRIKVRPDSVASVNKNASALPPVSSLIDKRSYRCDTGFRNERFDISRIYILADGNSICIERLPPAEAFIELTRHTYLNRYLGAAAKYKDHFQECSAIANAVDIFRLQRPRDYRFMPDVASAITRYRDNDGTALV